MSYPSPPGGHYYICNMNAKLTIGTSSELFLFESIVTDILYVI